MEMQKTPQKLEGFSVLRAAAYMWTALDNLLGSLILVLLEVLHEETTELLDLVLKAGSAVPAVAGVEEVIGDASALLGHLKVEDLVVLVLGVCELAVVDGVEDGAGEAQAASLAASGGSGTDPAGVEEPGVGVVLLDLLGEHLGVAHGVQGEEGLGEAGGEGGLGLGDTLLGTGHLGSVSGDEVVHGLRGVQLGDRGKDTAGVAGEEDNVLGVLVGNAGNLGVLNVLDRVGAAGVLGQGVVVVVYDTSDWVKYDVLEDRTEADGTVDIWFLLGREANALGVATTLDVEDTSVRPAVLVVTNQGTLGVSRQGGLSGSGQTEENGDIAILTFVGGRVQGEDVVFDRHLIVENGKDSFFHFPSILSTKDNHLLVLEVESNGCRRGHTASVSVGGESTGVVDGVVGLEVLQLLLGGADQHVAHEESMVGTSADNADAYPVALVPAGESIDDVDAVAGVEVVDSTLTVDAPDLVM
jgi:hypothetical protein